MTLGATNQGMVAGDLVNTASRLQSRRRRRAPCSSARRPSARPAGRSPSRRPASRRSRARPRRSPAWRAAAGRRRARRPEPRRDARGAVRRPRRRAAPAQGPVPRHGPRAAARGSSRSSARPASARPGSPGSSSSTSTASSRHVWWHDGRSPGLRRGDQLLGARRDGPRARRPARDRRRGDDPGEGRRDAREHVPDADERRWIEPALLALLGVESGVAARSSCSAPGGRSSSGSRRPPRSSWSSRTSTTPTRACSTSSTTSSSGSADVPIYVVTLARPELLERRPDWGAGKRNFTSLYLEPLPEPAMRELLAGLVPGLPEPAVRAIVARADGDPAVRGRDGPDARRRGPARARGRRLPPGRRPDRPWPCPRRSPRSSPAASTASPPTDRALVSDAAVLGQSFTLAGLAAVSGIDEADARAAAAGPRPARAADPRGRPAQPERGQYAFVQALIREVAYNTLARRDRKARHLAAARFFESSGSRRARRRPRRPLPRRPRERARGPRGRRARRPGADRPAGRGRARGRPRLARPGGRASSSRPSRSRPTRPRRPSCSSAPGDAADSAAHHDQAEALLRRAIEHRTASAATARARPGHRGPRPGAPRRRSGPSRPSALLEPAAEEFADLGPSPAFVALWASSPGRTHARRRPQRRSRSPTGSSRRPSRPTWCRSSPTRSSPRAPPWRTSAGSPKDRGHRDRRAPCPRQWLHEHAAPRSQQPRHQRLSVRSRPCRGGGCRRARGRPARRRSRIHGALHQRGGLRSRGPGRMG